jgi:hypothetical protein
MSFAKPISANADSIKGVPIDDTAKADGKVLTYIGADGKLEYRTPTGGGLSSATGTAPLTLTLTGSDLTGSVDLSAYLPLDGSQPMTGDLDMGQSGSNHGIIDVASITMATIGGTAGIDNVREITFVAGGGSTGITFGDSTIQNTAALPLDGTGTMTGTLVMGGNQINLDSTSNITGDGAGNISLGLNGDLKLGANGIDMGTGPISNVGSITFSDATIQNTAYTGGGGSTPTLGDILVAGSDASNGTIVNLSSLTMTTGQNFGVIQINEGAITFGDNTTQTTAWTGFLTPSSISGFPNNAAEYLDGSGAWSTPGAGSTPNLSAVLSAGDDAATGSIIGLSNVTTANLTLSPGGGSNGILFSDSSTQNTAYTGVPSLSAVLAAGSDGSGTSISNLGSVSGMEFSGGGSGLTGLSPSNLSGFPLNASEYLDGSGAWSVPAAAATFNQSLNTTDSVTFAGVTSSFTGDGSQISMLNAGNISGFIPSSQISGTVGSGFLDTTVNLSFILGNGNDAGTHSITNVDNIQVNTISANSTGINFQSGIELILNGSSLYMSNGTGSGGGTLSMDNGSITNANAISGVSGNTLVIGNGGESAIFFGNSQINVDGNSLNMNQGSGTGGTTLNMDSGTITTLASITFADSTSQSTAALPLTGGSMSSSGSGINMNTGNFSMNGGIGTGGSGVELDSAAVGFDNVGTISGDGAGNVTMNVTSLIINNGLPTADPHVIGQLWNNSGVLTISAG